MNRKKAPQRIGSRILLAVCLLLASVVPSLAWEIYSEVGVGAVYTGVYKGSDDFYLAPAPIAKVTLDHKNTSIYLSILDGLGARHMFGESGYFAEINFNFGDERDSESYYIFGVERDHTSRTKEFLRGTPTVTTDIVAKGTFGHFAQWGTFLLSVEYHPTRLDHPDDRFDEESINGLTYSLAYSLDGNIGDAVTVNGVAGLEFINGSYADAWYSNELASSNLNRFDASGGLHNLYGVLEVTGIFSDNFGTKTTLMAEFLMGAASDSPYTRQRLQPTGLIQVFYNF